MAIRRTLRGCGCRLRLREQDDVADGARAGEDHGEAVDADAFAGGGWEAEAERADVVLVHLVGFVVAAVALLQLVFEAAALVVGVVELGEGVADLEAADVELEALDPVGLVGLDLGERRDGEREVVDDCWLDEVRFGDGFKDCRNCLTKRHALRQQIPLVIKRARKALEILVLLCLKRIRFD